MCYNLVEVIKLEEKKKERKYWLDKFLLEPGDIRWLKIFYKVITWIFTAGLSLTVIGIVTGIVQMIIDSFEIGSVTMFTALGLGFSVVVIYFFGMLLLNLLDNNRITKENTEKIVELLEKMLTKKESIEDIKQAEETSKD